MSACLCSLDGEFTVYIDGTIYSPREDDNCGGACLYDGTCTCTCHNPAKETS